MTDPIADMIIRMKNAGDARKDTTSFPYSKIKHDICELLKKEGFVGTCTKKGKKTTTSIEVEILYPGDEPRITGVRKISKPSRRIYQGSKDIRRVKNGFGMLVLTTPKGIMTGDEARKEKIGGEALFEIW
jgi:small subunit ribosomal protein S8